MDPSSPPLDPAMLLGAPGSTGAPGAPGAAGTPSAAGAPGAPTGTPWSLWRYAGALPPLAVAGSPAVSMGEGLTPLVPGPGGVWLKLDFVTPTLSFKDRGAAVMVAGMSAAGVGSVVADSSGNAGAALAAYAARAGIAAEIFVPASTSPGKEAAIAGTGATVRRVEGDRAAATAAAVARLGETGAVYASHVHQPLFLHGTKTCAYELWEQLGGRAPGTVVCAAGNGSMVLGLDLGFLELQRAGLIERVPRVLAVQAQRCAPLLAGAHQGPAAPGPVAAPGPAAPAASAAAAPAAAAGGPGPTVAEGIAIADPPRGTQILEVLSRTGGRVLLAPEERIGAAQRYLGSQGVDVEPTAAAVWAAWDLARHAATGPADEDAPVVVILGGAGVKARRAP